MALTEDEAAVYDRQLRVWGVETQRKLTSARVMVLNVTGVAAELCKNIVLAGVGSVALVDGTPARAAPTGNFLVPADAAADATVAQASAATLSEMNPLVKVEALSAPDGCAPEALPASFFAGCRAVVLAGAPAAVAARVCDTCRAAGGVAFFAVDVGAAHGIFFEDLGAHTYVPSVPKKTDDDKPAPPAAPRTLQYCTLQEALDAPLSSLPPRCNHGYVLYRLRAGVEAALGPGASLRAEHAPALRSAVAAAQAAGLHARATPDEAHTDAYAGGCGAEWPPISAAVGGVLAQEVLKAISGSGAPVLNFFCFDTRANAGAIQAVGVKAA